MWFKEALNNISKHAGAHQVDITLALPGTRMILTIQDDGCGMDLKQPFRNSSNHGGYGLANMEKRVGFLNGEFSLRSSPGKGTSVCISIPLIPDTSIPQEPRSQGH